MTRLTKPVTRRVHIPASGHRLFGGAWDASDLVVTLAPEGILLRPYRKRTTFVLPYSRAFDSAARLAADTILAKRLFGRRKSRRPRR